MKKFLVSILFLVVTVFLYAQKDVTQFLDIPVDGTEAEMQQKLKAKGFNYSSYKDCFEGVFNGREVLLSIVTNGSKVYRIMLRDAVASNETNIKIRFNILCKQFERSPRYTSMMDRSQIISDDEDISYEMSVRNKRYEAVYFQKPNEVDTAAINQYVDNYIGNGMYEDLSEEQKEQLFSRVLMDCVELLYKKIVWFTIVEHYGDYYIAMYYDNEYNSANGEDL